MTGRDFRFISGLANIVFGLIMMSAGDAAVVRLLGLVLLMFGSYIIQGFINERDNHVR